MSEPYPFMGWRRYLRNSFDDFLPWGSFERLRVGASVPLLGTHPLRVSPLVAWHTPLLGRHRHTAAYRLKKSIVEGDFREFSVALAEIRDLDAPVTERTGLSALSLASLFDRDQMAKMLLMRGASVHATDRNGQTALHHALSSSNFRCTQILVEAGADSTARDSAGISPEDLARAKRSAALEKMLSAGSRGPGSLPRFELRGEFRGSVRGRHGALSRLGLREFGESRAYPFNDLKGTYCVSFHN